MLENPLATNLSVSGCPKSSELRHSTLSYSTLYLVQIPPIVAELLRNEGLDFPHTPAAQGGPTKLRMSDAAGTEGNPRYCFFDGRRLTAAPSTLNACILTASPHLV
jgi:hypothetical protein